MSSRPNSITQAQGIFSNCGPGVNTYELQYNCKGPACTSINSFQNVKCNTDGGTQICSNDVKCPSGISSYYSNFTFEQNEPDPWNPVSQNEPDSRVRQQQHVALPNCAKFSLTSDGTKAGTKIENEGPSDEKTCPKVKETPTPTAGTGLAKKTSSTGRPQVASTGKPQVDQSNHGSRRQMPKNILFVTFLFGLMMLLPGTHASSDHQRREYLRRRAELRVRDVSDKVKAFAQDFSAELAEKANAQGQNGEVFAHNLVADVVSSVCDEYFSGTRPSDFTPVVVQNCVKSVYGGERLAQPAGQFFAVFGASLLCDYVVSEAYPVAQEFFPDGCEGLQDLAKKISPTRSIAASNAVTPAASQASQPLASVSPPAQPSPSNLQVSNAATPLTVQQSAPASNTAPIPSNAASLPLPSNSVALTSPPPASAVVNSVPPSALSPVLPTPSDGRQSDGISPSIVPASEPATIVGGSQSLRTPAGSERPPPSSAPPSPSFEPSAPSEIIQRPSQSLNSPIDTSLAPRPSESRPEPSVIPPESSSPPLSRPDQSSPLPSASGVPSPPISMPPVAPSLSSPVVLSPSISPPARASPPESSPEPSLPSPPSRIPVSSAISSEVFVPSSLISTPRTPIVTPDPRSESSIILSNETPISSSISRPSLSLSPSSASSFISQSSIISLQSPISGTSTPPLISSPVSRESPTSITITISQTPSTPPSITPSVSSSTPSPPSPVSNSTVSTPTPIPCQSDLHRPDFCPRQGCVNFDIDNNNCGSCNKKCADPSFCHRGVCTCQNEELASPENNFCNGRNQTCEAPNSFCPGVGCLNLMTNTTHCGNCGTACQDSLECYKGTCLCPVTHKLPEANGRCNGTETKDCPDGQFLDEKYKKCCPTGSTWNQTRNACDEPVKKCEAGYAFDGETGLCCAVSFISDYPCICPLGLYKQDNGTCTDVPPVKCNPGQVLDSKYNICCEEGTAWNPSKEKCVPKDPICPRGQVLDPEYKKCCPEELVWNPQSNNCTSTQPKTCPQKNFVLIEELGFCCPLAQRRATSNTPEWYLNSCTCTNGKAIDSQTGCDGKSPCPPGEHVDEKYAKCCKDGWAYAPRLKQCIQVTSDSISPSATISSTQPPLRQASPSVLSATLSGTQSGHSGSPSISTYPTIPSTLSSPVPNPSPTMTLPSSVSASASPVLPTTAAPSCPLSLPDACNGICVNTSTDTAHCGHCGVSCPTGYSCADGACGTVRDPGVQPQTTAPLLRLPSDVAEPFKPFLNTSTPSETPKPVPKGAGEFIAKGLEGLWG